MKAAFAVELRAEGRTIRGPAIRYGDLSASHRERFEAGAFSADLASDRLRWLSYRHDVSRLICWTGAGLILIDGAAALEMAATVPETPIGDLLLREIEARKIGGLSLEFQAEAERMEGDIRVIERARLVGIGAVQNPSYDQSRIEMRSIEGDGGIIRLEDLNRPAEKPKRPGQNWSPPIWL